MNTLEVKSLTKWYGPVRGVEDLTFSVESGEIFGYLGPNGSGKTTTIRCLMGLLKPSRGESSVLGERVVPGRATMHSRIGYLPGDFRIWPTLKARRALGVLASLGDCDGRMAARRRQLAERLELDPDRPVGDLSRGNRQKVGVIHAFQHQPDVLILDEPTSGLDPLMRQVVFELIREAAGAGATVLLSSHDLSEVSAVCSRAGILREGRLVELAPIARIVQQGERRLRVWFAEGAGLPPVPLDQLPGVRIVERESDLVHFAYRGAPDALLKWISRFPIDRIAMPETSLEEAFIRYYRKDDESARGEGDGRGR